MVQGIMELLFDAAYLIFTFTVGVYLIVKGRSKFIKLFGVMAVVLSSGDAFHLIPRVYALLSTAKTSENTSFSEVFCCFSGKNGTFTHSQNGVRFCAVF